MENNNKILNHTIKKIIKKQKKEEKLKEEKLKEEKLKEEKLKEEKLKEEFNEKNKPSQSIGYEEEVVKEISVIEENEKGKSILSKEKYIKSKKSCFSSDKEKKSTIKNSYFSSLRYSLPSEFLKNSSSSIVELNETPSISEEVNISDLYFSDINLNIIFEEISNSINITNKKEIERFNIIKGDLNDIYFTEKIYMENNKGKVNIPKLDIEIKRDLSEEGFLINHNIRVNILYKNILNKDK